MSPGLHVCLLELHGLWEYTGERAAAVYVPEMDPITGEEFHEMEDHNHPLKVY